MVKKKIPLASRENFQVREGFVLAGLKYVSYEYIKRNVLGFSRSTNSKQLARIFTLIKFFHVGLFSIHL